MWDKYGESLQGPHGDQEDDGYLPAPGKVTLTSRLAPRAAYPGMPLPAELRAQFEASLGTDLGGVRVHDGAPSAEASRNLGARAFAVGDDIHLASPVDHGDPFGVHLLAHEVAHTVQQRGAAPHAQTKLDTSTPGDASEREADDAADAMVEGRPARVGRTPARLARFSDQVHQAVTVEGLKHTAFTPQEIGAVYAANWERDFAQSGKELAQIVLAWKGVKEAAQTSDQARFDAAAAQLRAAIKTALTTDFDAMVKDGKSFSSDDTWNHADRPPSGPNHDADRRWGQKANGLAGHLADARAFIKDQMMAAVDTYRVLSGTGDVVSKGIDNWNGVAKPKGYDSDTIARAGAQGDTQVPALSRDVVRDETATKAGANPGDGVSQPKDQQELWRRVAHHLGKAMHTFEDFWSHSNWVELAIGLKKEGKMSTNKDLHSGEFDLTSKIHALGHKLTRVAGNVRRERDLLRRALSSPDDAPTGSPLKQQLARKEMMRLLGIPSALVAGHYFDVKGTAGEAATANRGGVLSLAQLATDGALIDALEAKGKKMIGHAEGAAGKDSHAKLAKDQEGDRNFATAKAVAIAADKYVFGLMKQVMITGDPQLARETLIQQLGRVDQVMAAPTTSHPLWPEIMKSKDPGAP